MLRELHIQNFAIIQDLKLEFKSGLVVFTGETGAGKSIILDALSAVIGERVDTSLIRKGAERALIEAEFVLNEQTSEAVQPILSIEDLWDDTLHLSLGREIRSEGRSVARVNGRSVSLSLLSEIGSLLVDLHGQSEHLSLLKVKNHLDLLDRFANQEEALKDYQSDYKQLQSLEKELRDLLVNEKNASERMDMLRYQIQELEGARLAVGEEEGLRAERSRLANAEALSMLSQEALVLLDEGNQEVSPATDLVGQVSQRLAELARIDPQMQALAERTDDVLSALSDIAYELRGYSDSIEFNPKRLDQIEERLNLLSLLKRKYGGTIDSALDYLANARLELTKVEQNEGQIEQVKKNTGALKQSIAIKAQGLSETRQKASEILKSSVQEQLENLQMKKARFNLKMEVKTDPDGLSSEKGSFSFDNRGIDQVEFLVETNPGEGFKPLAKVASGGETSRLMLAMKHVLADADQIPTLIFDEIDSGIGGRVAMSVGEMLWQLGNEHQVMCVTHLAQLAAFGDQHFQVIKEEENGRTLTQVKELDNNGRLLELAAMIGTITDGTLQSAQEMLDVIQKITSKI